MSGIGFDERIGRDGGAGPTPHRDRLTPTLRIYRLDALRLLNDARGDRALYRKLTVRQVIGQSLRLESEQPAWVAVIDLEPTANLTHPHLYRVWQIQDGRQVQAELFFHGLPLGEWNGIVEIEPEEVQS